MDYSFDQIREIAENRKGGSKGLKSILPVVKKVDLSAMPDDRYLAIMTEYVNNAGFNWKVIRNKWPGYEEVYEGFDIDTLLGWSQDKWDSLLKDTRIIRNGSKIDAVRLNTLWFNRLRNSHGSFGNWLKTWDTKDQAGLMMHLKKHGARLGGYTAQYFLRHIGFDAYILSTDVVTALNEYTPLHIAHNPSTQRDLRAVQEKMNEFQKDSGLPYTTISKILAFSAGENRYQ